MEKQVKAEQVKNWIQSEENQDTYRLSDNVMRAKEAIKSMLHKSSQTHARAA